MKHVPSSEQTERRLHEGMRVAMSLLDWILPDTEGVVRAKSHDDEEIREQLPDELRDPLAVFDRDRLTVH